MVYDRLHDRRFRNNAAGGVVWERDTHAKEPLHVAGHPRSVQVYYSSQDLRGTPEPRARTRWYRRAYWLAGDRHGGGLAVVQYRRLDDALTKRREGQPRAQRLSPRLRASPAAAAAPVTPENSQGLHALATAAAATEAAPAGRAEPSLALALISAAAQGFAQSATAAQGASMAARARATVAAYDLGMEALGFYLCTRGRPGGMQPDRELDELAVRACGSLVARTLVG